MMFKKNFTSKGSIQILLHLLAWTTVFLLPQYIISRYTDNNRYIHPGFYINLAIYGITFYVNYFVLVPYLLFKDKKFKYVVAVLILLVGLFFVSDQSFKILFRRIEIELNDFTQSREYEDFKPDSEFNEYEEAEPIPPPPEDRFSFLRRGPFRSWQVYNYTLTFLFIVFFSLGLRVLERHAKSEKRQKELEKEKLNSELAFLKNQVSPHFFFNTLNNIYSLIKINSNDAQEAVLTLSKLMRYLLYESEHGETRLNKEIQFMQNYIDLMKLRLTEKVSLEVTFPDNGENLNIPPLLFIPFIENAFKHGISYREKSFIKISLALQKDMLHFQCINSIGRKQDESAEDEYSGIGLENAKKRLMLLFPKKHNLSISQTNNEFNVSLKIILN